MDGFAVLLRLDAEYASILIPEPDFHTISSANLRLPSQYSTPRRRRAVPSILHPISHPKILDIRQRPHIDFQLVHYVATKTFEISKGLSRIILLLRVTKKA